MFIFLDLFQSYEVCCLNKNGCHNFIYLENIFWIGDRPLFFVVGAIPIPKVSGTAPGSVGVRFAPVPIKKIGTKPFRSFVQKWIKTKIVVLNFENARFKII
jgi:hypothetical protein